MAFLTAAVGSDRWTGDERVEGVGEGSAKQQRKGSSRGMGGKGGRDRRHVREEDSKEG